MTEAKYGNNALFLSFISGVKEYIGHKRGYPSLGYPCTTPSKNRRFWTSALIHPLPTCGSSRASTIQKNSCEFARTHGTSWYFLDCFLANLFDHICNDLDMDTFQSCFNSATFRIKVVYIVASIFFIPWGSGTKSTSDDVVYEQPKS